MLLLRVYGETMEQAEKVAGMIERALDEALDSVLVFPSLAGPEAKSLFGVSHYPAIIKNGVLLWQGSVPSDAMVLQWIEESTAQCDEVSGASGRFGYDLSNPIPADGNWYCRRLRCPSGHPFWYQRLGSVGASPDGHIVDHLQLLCFGRESEVFLYFDMYHKGPSSLVPEDLCWARPLQAEAPHQGGCSTFPKDFTMPDDDSRPLEWDDAARISCEFAFKCPRLWERLTPTENGNVRHCSACDRDVHLALTEEDFRQHADAGRCVAIRVFTRDGTERADRDYWVGRPGSAYGVRLTKG